MIEITKRMKLIANTVTKGNVVADIGCDHGYVSIYLIKQDISPKVIAMDLREGPLKKAKTNTRQSNDKKVIENIEFRISNGFEKLKPKEVDTAIIAGMGGGLICKIIKDGEKVVRELKELIISPQSEIADVRHFLHDNGYRIVSQWMIKDDGKFYTVIKVVNGKDIDYTEIEYKYGKKLIDEKNQILREYLEWDKKRLEKVAASIENKDGENVEARKKQLVDNLAEINDVLEVVAYGRNV